MNFRLCLELLREPFQQEAPLTRYPTDFFIPSRNLAVEVDGVYWHTRAKSDARKVAKLVAAGYRVIRVPDTPFYGDLTPEMVIAVGRIIRADKDNVSNLTVICGNPVTFAEPVD